MSSHRQTQMMGKIWLTLTMNRDLILLNLTQTNQDLPPKIMKQPATQTNLLARKALPKGQCTIKSLILRSRVHLKEISFLSSRSRPFRTVLSESLLIPISLLLEMTLLRLLTNLNSKKDKPSNRLKPISIAKSATRKKYIIIQTLRLYHKKVCKGL